MMTNRNILHLIKNMADKYPDREILVHPKENGSKISLTYEELRKRVNQYAHYMLLEHGVKPGDRIVILSEKGIDTTVAILASWSVGCTCAPVNVDIAEPIMQRIFQQLGQHYLLTESKLINKAKAVSSSTPTILDDLTFLNQLGQFPISDMNLEYYHADAYIVFTSGSTGAPKAVVSEHKGLYAASQSWKYAYNLSEDRILNHGSMAPIGFDVSFGDYARALCFGGKMVIIPSYILCDPEKLYKFIVDEKINIAEFVPAVLNQLMDYMQKNNKTIDHPFTVIYGSDKVLMETPRRIKVFFPHPNTNNVNSYGASEAYIDTMFQWNPDLIHAYLRDHDPVPIGRPFDHAIIYIRTEEGQTVVMRPNEEPYLFNEEGEKIKFTGTMITGELLIGGYTGRYLDPELTNKKFVPDPFTDQLGGMLYHSGDQVSLNIKTGAVTLDGRNEDFIKLNGKRTGIGLIETLIRQNSQIEDCYLKTSKEQPNHIECYIVGNNITHDEIMSHLSKLGYGAIMPHMDILKVDSIKNTKNSNGKVKREPIGKREKLKPDVVQWNNVVEMWLADAILTLRLQESCCQIICSDKNLTQDIKNSIQFGNKVILQKKSDDSYMFHYSDENGCYQCQEASGLNEEIMLDEIFIAQDAEEDEIVTIQDEYFRKIFFNISIPNDGDLKSNTNLLDREKEKIRPQYTLEQLGLSSLKTKNLLIEMDKNFCLAGDDKVGTCEIVGKSLVDISNKLIKRADKEVIDSITLQYTMQNKEYIGNQNSLNFTRRALGRSPQVTAKKSLLTLNHRSYNSSTFPKDFNRTFPNSTVDQKQSIIRKKYPSSKHWMKFLTRRGAAATTEATLIATKVWSALQPK